MRNLLLVGNANTGKTTLINSMTNGEEHTGNWHGVTVEEKQRFYSYSSERFSVVDLPGIYSLNALSLEEQVSINYIFSHSKDLIINTCDINTLSKNLFLTLDLLTMKKDIILVVNNMGDKTKSVDTKKLKNELGIEVLVIDFDNKKEVNKLKKIIFNYRKNNTKINYINKFYSKNTVNKINEINSQNSILQEEIIKIIEKNNYFIKKYKKNNKIINIIENNYKINYFLLAEEKFFFIDNLLTSTSKNRSYGNEILDKIFLNKFLAIPIFLAIMLAIFYLTFFSLGSFFSDFFSNLIQFKLGGLIVSLFESICSVDWIIDLIENGFFGGVGSLISFLPQVVLLFLFLAIMEDSGYFSRIAFIFEDFFSSLGLSGKSIYTLLMSFGCSASAVLTTRAMDNKSAKIKTAILSPYMSCSAKLPIYAVLGGAFFGDGNIFIIFLLYILGVFTALFVSVLLDKLFGLKNKENAFLIEFPPYRLPKIKKICRIAWLNLKLFLVKVATIFVSMSVIIWCLGSFSFSFEYVVSSGGKSILQVIGEFLSPIFLPLGFGSWGAVSALIAGIVAKEIIVSSLAIFNGISMFNENAVAKISNSLTNPSSVVSFTASSAISYLTFCLLYCPCLATMAVMKKEIGFKWTFIAVVLQLIIAYAVAFIVFNLYKLASVIGIFSEICLIFTILIILFSIFRFFSYIKQKNKCKFCSRCKF